MFGYVLGHNIGDTAFNLLMIRGMQKLLTMMDLNYQYNSRIYMNLKSQFTRMVPRAISFNGT